jgi:Relaxase/Mobilisation nuclease domain
MQGMTRRVIDLGSGRALLDIASFGRGSGQRFTPAQRLQIALTVRRAPEVVVKVSGGARSMAGVEAHFSYIGREGSLAIELDDGSQINGKEFQKAIALDWDLDLEDHHRQDARSIRGRRQPPKLVHNVIFSMPPGTSAKRVLAAVRQFAVNEFALKHRYAMVLHTDEAHPHVHLVVKAVSERGRRLYIRKATLREWRQAFSSQLREQGIAANATERAVRGQVRDNKKDGIYRSMSRNESVHRFKRLQGLANREPDAIRAYLRGKAELDHTRAQVIAGWRGVLTPR